MGIKQASLDTVEVCINMHMDRREEGRTEVFCVGGEILMHGANA
jgi:hypothetical protein